MRQPFDDAVADIIAKTFSRDLGIILDRLREEFPRVPREFDFGILSKLEFDFGAVNKLGDARCLFKLRITGGNVTVREEYSLPASVVCHKDEEVFNREIDAMLIKLATRFAANFAV